jgi:hypothetical protein
MVESLDVGFVDFLLPFTRRADLHTVDFGSVFLVTKKADVVEHPKVFDHVGLLCNKPPGPAGLSFT